jgi:hypothetical protein
MNILFNNLIVLVRSPGFEPGSSAWEASSDSSLVNQGLEIDFQRVRGDFVTFLESKRLTSSARIAEIFELKSL